MYTCETGFVTRVEDLAFLKAILNLVLAISYCSNKSFTFKIHKSSSSFTNIGSPLHIQKDENVNLMILIVLVFFF